MKSLPSFLPALALLAMVAACDRKPDERSQSDGTSAPAVAPSKVEETTATPSTMTPSSPSGVSPAGEVAGNAGDNRRGALSGAGADICGEWNLAGDALTECRRQWMDAHTDADRLAIRNRYAPGAGAKEAREPAIDRDPQALNNPTFCDQFPLRDADRSECRAQWKAAKTEGDLARIRDRYAAMGAQPGKGGTRENGAPAEAPAANKATGRP